MPAANVTLPPIEKYATYSHTITWTDETGAGINLVGCTADMMIKLTQGVPDIVFELSTTNGRIVITDPINGVMQLTINSTDTATVPVESLVYDLVVTFPSGTKTRLIQGAINVNDGVTYG
jgi:hypothetical protein